MRVRCIASAVPEPLRTAISLGPTLEGRRSFGVTPGRTYIVYALDINRGIPWVHVEVERDELIPVPLVLFEIVDPIVPDAWEARIAESGSLLLWPAAFFLPGFPERVYSGDEAARATMQRLRKVFGEPETQE